MSCALPPSRVLLRVWKRNEKRRKETKECIFKRPVRETLKRTLKRKGGQLVSFSCAQLRKKPLKEKGSTLLLSLRSLLFVSLIKDFNKPVRHKKKGRETKEKICPPHGTGLLYAPFLPLQKKRA